ncbi:MAG: glycosyltransferase [archaeon]|nr:glycosyltransferase [archaeon]
MTKAPPLWRSAKLCVVGGVVLALAIMVVVQYPEHERPVPRPPLSPPPSRILYEGAEGAEDRVFPRTVHHVWISNDPPPQMWQPNMDKWLDLHPGWTQQMWDYRECHQLIRDEYAWYLPHFLELRMYIQMADVCRYFLLHARGGIYADLDMYPRRSFEAVLQEAEEKQRRVLVLERYKDPQTGGKFDSSYLAIGMLASVPGAAFWDRVFETLKERATNPYHMYWVLDHYRVIHQTGPHCLMAAYFEDSRGVGLLRQELFFPCDIICTPIQSCVRSYPKAMLLIGYGRTWNGWFTLAINWFLCHLSVKTLLHVTCPFGLTALWALFHFYRVRSLYFSVFLWLVIGVYACVMLFTPLSPHGFPALAWALLLSFISLGSSSFDPRGFLQRHHGPCKWFLGFALCFAALYFISLSSSSSLVALRPQTRVLFLVGHPDDADAFFAPSIKGLRDLGAEVQVLSVVALGASPHRNDDSDEIQNIHVSVLDDFDAPWYADTAALALLQFLETRPYRFSAIVTYGHPSAKGYPSRRAAHETIHKAASALVAHHSVSEECPLGLYAVRESFAGSTEPAEDRASFALGWHVNHMEPLYDVAVHRMYHEPTSFVTSAVARNKKCPFFLKE